MLPDIDNSEVRNRIEKIINPQVGLIAIFALSLSVLNTCYQVWQLTRSSQLQLLQPEQILIVPDRYPTGNVFVRFAARFSYVNLGPPQKSTVVTKEVLGYTIAGQTFAQQWQSFENFTGRTCELSSAESKDVHPIVLSGEDAESHVTYFAPRSAPDEENHYINFQSLDNFVSSTLGEPIIEVFLLAEVLDKDDVVMQKCKIHLTENERQNIQRGCATTLSCM